MRVKNSDLIFIYNESPSMQYFNFDGDFINWCIKNNHNVGCN